MTANRIEVELSIKRWGRIIPVVTITYSLAYIDWVNFGFAAADKITAELGITPAISSLLGSLFFLATFFPDTRCPL
jgi:hypothetical protein